MSVEFELEVPKNGTLLIDRVGCVSEGKRDSQTLCQLVFAAPAHNQLHS